MDLGCRLLCIEDRTLMEIPNNWLNHMQIFVIELPPDFGCIYPIFIPNFHPFIEALTIIFEIDDEFEGNIFLTRIHLNTILNIYQYYYQFYQSVSFFVKIKNFTIYLFVVFMMLLRTHNSSHGFFTWNLYKSVQQLVSENMFYFGIALIWSQILLDKFCYIAFFLIFRNRMISRRNKSYEHLQKQPKHQSMLSFQHTNSQENRDTNGVLGNLMNAKKLRRSRMNKLQSKIFWTRNNMSQETVQRIRQKSLEEKSSRKEQAKDIFRKDQQKYEKITQATLKTDQLSLPQIRDNAQTYHIPIQPPKHKAFTKVCFPKQKKQKNFMSLSPIEQSCIMQKRYKERCKREVQEFNFNFAAKQENKQIPKKVKKTKFQTSPASKNDESVPQNFIDLFNPQKMR